MNDEVAATAPAVNSAETGSGGLTSEQAAARLFANAAKAAAQRPTEQAAEKTPLAEPPAPSTEVPAAEAQPASAETATTEGAQAEPETVTTDESTTGGEPADANDDVLSPATLDEKLKSQIQKRIDKEVSRRKALETRIAEMEAQLNARAQPNTTTSDPANGAANNSNTIGEVPLMVPNQPLAKVNDLPSLKQQEQMAKDALRWAEDTLENPRAWKVKTDVDPDTGAEVATRITTIGKEVYDEAAIRAVRRDAKIMLEDHIPQRKEFLTQRTQAQKTAHDSYPFLRDKNSADYQLAQQMLRDPWVQMRPDAEWIVGTQITGIRALEQRRADAVKKAEPAKPKPAPAKPSNDQSAVSSSGSPSRVNADTAQRLARSADRTKLVAKGGITAAEAAAFLERSSNSRKSG